MFVNYSYMKTKVIILFVLLFVSCISSVNSLNAQSTNFKLQEDKFYKVESLIFDDIVLPFEAELPILNGVENTLLLFVKAMATVTLKLSNSLMQNILKRMVVVSCIL